jgi:N-acetylglutamate synthase-like GNAT family acetyltransferase
MPNTQIIQNLTLPRSIVNNLATLRLAEAKDDEAIRQIIVNTLAEFGYTEDCPANDPEVVAMSQYIAQHANARFYVIEENESGQVVGCGGFESLKRNESQDRIAELIKFYVIPAYRDEGLGEQVLQQALWDAKQCGYDSLYYEVTPRLFSKSLFERLGFYFVPDKLGNNGHFHPEINIFVLRPLAGELTMIKKEST